MIVAMRWTRPAASPRAERLALAAVAIALFGLMSMHGWGSHSSQPLSLPIGGAAHALHANAVAADSANTMDDAMDNPWYGPREASVRDAPQTLTHQAMYAAAAGGKPVSVRASQHRDIADQHPTSTGTDDTGEAGRDGHGGHGGLVGLCLAILAGLVLLAFLLTRHRGVHPLAAWLPAWPLPVSNGRDRAPPDLFRLCVVRC